MTSLQKNNYSGLPSVYNIKKEVNMLDFLYVSIALQLMFIDFTSYCADNGLIKPTITRIIDEKIPGVSVSKTHQEGRAIDVRSNCYSDEEIKGIVNYITAKHKHSGAISFSDGKSRPIVYHKGTANHFHLQVRR